eukprot:gene7097-14442_t
MGKCLQGIGTETLAMLHPSVGLLKLKKDSSEIFDPFFTTDSLKCYHQIFLCPYFKQRDIDTKVGGDIIRQKRSHLLGYLDLNPRICWSSGGDWWLNTALIRYDACVLHSLGFLMQTVIVVNSHYDQ